MKANEEPVLDTIDKAKRARTNAKCKFTRKCNAFMELSERSEQILVLQDKFNDIRENFKILDNANDHLVNVINETAPHHLMDNLLQDCDAYMKEIETTLDKIRAVYASHISASSSKSSQLHVKALDSPRFSGNIRDYSNFKQDFDRLMAASYGKDPYALRSCLFGPALQIVKGVEDDYDKMFQRLDKTYGDPRKFVDTIIQDIKSIRPVQNGDSKKFIAMVDVIERCWLDLERMKLTEEMNTVAMVSMIEKLLPSVQKREWIRYLDSSDINSRGIFEQLLNYLLREKRVLEYTEHEIRTDRTRSVNQTNISPLDPSSYPSTSAHQWLNYSSRSDSGSQTQLSTRNWCWIHKTQGHSIENCNHFIKMNISEKFKAVRTVGACYNCLQTTRHIAKNCTVPNKCDVMEAGQTCGKRHHPLLHINRGESKGEQNPEIYNFRSSQNRPVIAVSSIQSKNQHINVMWDSGSNISLITHRTASRLGLRGSEINLSIIKVGNDSTSMTSREYHVPLTDLSGKVWTICAYGIDEITANIQQIDLEDIKIQFPDIDIMEISRPAGNIDMLIGVDSCFILPTVIRTTRNCQLLKNQFGYCVRGSFDCLPKGKENTSSTIIRINQTNIESHLHGIKIESQKNIMRKLEDFFNIESLGIRYIPKCGSCRCGKCLTGANNYTLREERELGMIRDGLKYDNRHKIFTVEYPWIKDPNNLPNNINAALAKLRSTENRLRKLSVEHQKAYQQQMKDMENRGVSRKLSEEELEKYNGPIHYIHHHEVLKPNSLSTPIRIVFNSSACYMGHALNDYWAKGPDFINNLYGVLLRFRENRVAVTADISKMYNSIQISERDQHVHRYLWRDLQTDQNANHYVLTAVPFGDRPSGAIVLTALHTIAERFRSRYPDAANMITNNSYVDDLIQSVTSTTEALEIAKQVQTILAEGNFTIKHWTILGQEQLVDLNIKLSTGERQRVLGILWEPSSDKFLFDMKFNFYKGQSRVSLSPSDVKNDIQRGIPTILTRRMLLRQTAAIYDPLGLIVPFTIKGKLLMRNLTRQLPNQSIDWDEPVPEANRADWVTFFSDMLELNNIYFERCLQPPDATGQPILVVFSDASSLAYGACAYVQWLLKSGEYKSSLISAKNRISPNRQLSIPRLELCGAIVGCRLAETLIKEMKYKFREVIFIVDSTIVRAQIQKQSYGFGTFVATRIAEIQEKSSPSQWWWTDSCNNPADLTTRCAKPEDLISNSIWQTGPKFLCSSRENWPISQKPYEQELPDRIIVNVVCGTDGTIEQDICNDIPIDNFSSYDKLIRVTARVLSVAQHMSLKGMVKPLTIELMSQAETRWIKHAQKRIIDNWQIRFKRLGPSLNEQGILVVGNRIAKWLRDNWNQEFYILLPHNHRLTYLYICKLHHQDHGGVEATLAKLQTKFWVPGARRLIKGVKQRCVSCRKMFSRPQHQLMGPVNPERLKPSPAFHNTALDLFGPFLIKDTVKRRTKTKAYGVLFTCFASRASYVDLVEGYSTQDFLLAFRRFVTIRGYPATIYSDAGSQLAAANRELREMTKRWNIDDLTNTGVNHGLTWKFTKSSDAPWENGCSESLIRIIKRTLTIAIGENILTFGELQTILFEAANLLNERPIGRKPGSDPLSGSYLSPNDLLLGRTNNNPPQGQWAETSRLANRFLFLQNIVTTFWKKWYRDYFTTLLVQQKWHLKQRNFQIGDIVLIQEDKPMRGSWRLAEIIQIEASSDGNVRDVTLRYKPPTEGKGYAGRPYVTVRRSTHRLVLLIEADTRS